MATGSMSPALLNQWIDEVYNKTERRSLLGEESPKTYLKCTTPLVRFALSHESWLYPENRFILYKPDDPSYIRYDSLDNDTMFIYDTEHFKIHYYETGINAVYGADGDPNTTPQYVLNMGSYFEQVWDHEINILGYDLPETYLTGGLQFEVYIMHFGSYGETAISNGQPFFKLHNNYTGFESNQDPEGSRIGNMKITAAHEFFHAVQYFYDDWDEDYLWWEENTAVWMEDEVFDEVNGYLNYLGTIFDDLNADLKWNDGEPWYRHIDGSLGGYSNREPDVWFEYTEAPLDTAWNSTYDRYEYGGVMWAKYLAATFGEGFIKETFVIANVYTDALTAIQNVLLLINSPISFEEIFFDFRSKVLTLDFFEEGDLYPLINHSGNYQSQLHPIITTKPLSHLSSEYIGLKGPLDAKKLSIQIEQHDPNMALGIVLFKQNGYDVQYISINDLQMQIEGIELLSFGDNGFYKRATLIPLNHHLSYLGDYKQMTVSVQLAENVKQTLRLRQGINFVSLPTNLPGASTSHEFLSSYMDLSEELQFAAYDPNHTNWQISYITQDQPYQLKGVPFLIDWRKAYILSVSQDMVISLFGDLPVQETIDLLPGRNVISSLMSDPNRQLPGKVLESTQSDSGERISSSIKKFDHDQGKMRSGYWFFGKFSGNNFEIQKGEGYMIDMIEGREGWSPPQS